LLFLVVTFWYWCVIAFLLFTKFGRSFFDYLISFFVPGWNRYVLDRMMRNDPHRTRLLIRNYVLRQQQRIERLANEASTETEQGGSTQQGTGQTTASGDADVETEPVETRKPTSLALRTRILKKSDHPDSYTTDDPCLSAAHADDDDDACTICFAPLLDGERVGELGCAHVFHVECLKLWLQRKNICPLCQKIEVAEPRYDDKIATDQEEAVTDSSSFSQEADNSALADGTIAQAPQESGVEDTNNDDPPPLCIANPGLEEASTQTATEGTQNSPGPGGMAPESH
jgi:hypothetical protein